MNKTKYETLVNKYIDCIYRVALNSCNCREDAEDAVQNSFAKLWTNKKELATDEDAKRWLIRVVINECRTMWRGSKRLSTIEFEDVADEPAVDNDDYSFLFDAIQILAPKYRQVIYLYYFEGYKIKEIAEMIDVSETSIQTRLMRARKMLKNELGGE